MEGSIAQVHLNWIPGHEVLPKNKTADQVAREALDQITDIEAPGPSPLATAGRKARAVA